jgi:TonB family protein
VGSFFQFWEGVVSMGVKWGSRVLAVVTLSILAGSLVSGHQTTSVEDSKRKIKFKTNPQYSELARSMRLSGKVKIELVIAPDGHVKSSRAVGGHPLLVQSCQEAVKDWRFEPGPEETTQIVEFDFKQ